MSGFTPGPWTYQPHNREAIAPGVVEMDDDNACGDPECCGPASYWIEIKPEDGRLIAAAPELLASLQKVIEWAWQYAELCDDPDSDVCKDVAAAANAIVKATGETK